MDGKIVAREPHHVVVRLRASLMSYVQRLSRHTDEIDVAVSTE